MRLHPRTLPVQAAGNKLDEILWNFQDENGLTYVEMLRLLISHQEKITKYMLRTERHGKKSDKNADEE